MVNRQLRQVGSKSQGRRSQCASLAIYYLNGLLTIAISSVGRESGVRGSVPKNRSDVGSPLFQPIPDHTSYLEPIHVRTQEK